MFGKHSCTYNLLWDFGSYLFFSLLVDRGNTADWFVFVFQQADESLNFEEQILEAAKSIATATAALVKAASVAQRELVEQGKVSIVHTQC